MGEGEPNLAFLGRQTGRGPSFWGRGRHERTELPWGSKPGTRTDYGGGEADR